MLETINLNRRLTRAQYDEELPRLQVRLRELHWECFERRIPAMFVFEGWDAAGKGGAIKRLTQILDPRGYHVVAIAAPTSEERRYHYLWRFWKHLPKAGHFTVFDRSWYGRVMVERVEGFCSEEAWRRAYREINEFEQQFTNYGGVVCKFFLHISKAEQLRRFEQRADDPFRSYKLTDEDWRNREKWGHYQAAVDEMLERTSTTWAPWTVVEATDKLYARVKVLKTAVEALDAAVKGKNLAKRLKKTQARLERLAEG
jgi:polyphosphate kinase 2 (PPK2 family)